MFVPGLSESEVKFNEVPKETKKHPVVIFMHGCGGINESTLRWGKFLSELGYIAVFQILMLFQDEKNIATPKIKSQMQEMQTA